jgi:hypothetical protein
LAAAGQHATAAVKYEFGNAVATQIVSAAIQGKSFADTRQVDFQFGLAKLHARLFAM